MSNYQGRWTADEHALFLQGLQLHGRSWQKIAEMIPGRTNTQVKSHAHKFERKQSRAAEGDSRPPSTSTKKKPRNGKKSTVQKKKGLSASAGGSDVAESGQNSQPSASSARGTEGRAFEQGSDTHHNMVSSHKCDAKVSFGQLTVMSGESELKAMLIDEILTNFGANDRGTPKRADKRNGCTGEVSFAGIERVSYDSTSPSKHLRNVEGVEMSFLDESNSSCGRKISLSPTEKVLLTNYDVLCGSSPAYFHNIGNRRFRVLIELRMQTYEQYFIASCLPNVMDAEMRMMHYLDEVLTSLKLCSPPCRFLEYTGVSGQWQVMDDAQARNKIDETFRKCLDVRKVRFDNFLLASGEPLPEPEPVRPAE
ncbi:hypothetical protein ACHAXT_009286 [Thalassiosira profunda]